MEGGPNLNEEQKKNILIMINQMELNKTPEERQALRLQTEVRGLRESAQSNFTRSESRGQNPNFEMRYPERYRGVWEKSKIDIQFAKTGQEAIMYTDKSTGFRKTVDIVAKVWTTQEKKDEKGVGDAVCYILGNDGNWYRETGTKFTYDSKLDTNLWEMGDASQLEPSEKVNVIDNLMRVKQTPVAAKV